MLIDNILFLRERFPSIRKYLNAEKERINKGLFTVIPSKQEIPTIQYQSNSTTKPIMVHSLYDPVREAERIIMSNKDKIKEGTHVFFYGVGMGYHIESFQKAFPNHTYSVFEPNSEVFLRLSEYRDLNLIFSRKLIHFYLSSLDGDKSYIKEFQTNNHNIHIITLSSYQNFAKSDYETFIETIGQAIKARRTNLHTNVAYEKRWIENSIINFSQVCETPNILMDIDLDHFNDKPVIIISAGPSLAEDIKQIRYIKENNLAYLFSVGSAINSLIEFDLLPDVVMTYDPKKRNQNVFKKMYEKKINSIPMLFGTSVGFETINKYTGPKIHFITSQDKTAQYFFNELKGIENCLIKDSPSIAVMAFQLLNKLGVQLIIFSGQNLAYLDGKRFSEGINYSHKPIQVDSSTLKRSKIVEDVYGNEIKTSDSFNNMRESLEHYAKLYPDKTFINTTKGGAAIKGIPFMTIEETISNVLKKPIVKKNWWTVDKSKRADFLSEKYFKLEESIENFHILLSQYEKVIYALKKSLVVKHDHDVNVSLVKFDQIFANINKNLFYKYFLSYYIRTQVTYILNEMRKINNENNLYSRGRIIINNARLFIPHLKEGTYRLERLIKEQIKSIISVGTNNEIK